MAQSIRGTASGIQVQITVGGALRRSVRINSGTFSPGIGSEDVAYVGVNGPVPEAIVTGPPMLELDVNTNLDLLSDFMDLRAKLLGDEALQDYRVNASFVFTQPGVGERTVSMADCTVDFGAVSLTTTGERSTQSLTLKCEHDNMTIA